LAARRPASRASASLQNRFVFYPGKGLGGFAGPGQYKASGWSLKDVFAAN
jgi:hypothetical protein